MRNLITRVLMPAAALLAAVAATACGGADAIAPEGTGKDIMRRWYVYRDSDYKGNHGVWSGWMPAEAADMLKLDLKHAQDPKSGSTCARVQVALAHPWWCGIAVQCKEDYWGEEPYDGAYDLSKARKLVFDVKGQEGGESVQFKVAIAGDKPYGDATRIAPATSWITLTKTWQTVELDLRRANLKRVITPFCWVTNIDHNSDGKLTFYLDNIHFVMEGAE